MQLTTSIKSFSELSNEELYAIIRLRNEVFVVEQNCVFQDADNKDQKAGVRSLRGKCSDADTDAGYIACIPAPVGPEA